MPMTVSEERKLGTPKVGHLSAYLYCYNSIMKPLSVTALSPLPHSLLTLGGDVPCPAELSSRHPSDPMTEGPTLFPF